MSENYQHPIDVNSGIAEMLASGEKLPHATRIAALLKAGKKKEAKSLHAAYVDQQLKAASRGPINLSDLMAGREAFIIDEIEAEEGGAQ